MICNENISMMFVLLFVFKYLSHFNVMRDCYWRRIPVCLQQYISFMLSKKIGVRISGFQRVFDTALIRRMNDSVCLEVIFFGEILCFKSKLIFFKIFLYRHVNNYYCIERNNLFDAILCKNCIAACNTDDICLKKYFTIIYQQFLI